VKVSVFGLGYVGAVTAACLARDGHDVIGVDVNNRKVEMVLKGSSPFVEPGLEQVISDAVAQGRLTATTSAADAVRATDVSLISVGTPTLSTGEPDLSYVYGVCAEIGESLKNKPGSHTVVLRSTVPPGTLPECRNILLNHSGEIDVNFAFNPEFLREGTALRDYSSPPYTVIGSDDPVAVSVVNALYAKVQAPVIVVQPGVAEISKCVANAWHAAKISFANEVGRIATACGIDGYAVMDLIAQDTKLNVSPTYMRPGFAYGGSCLPKDLAALVFNATARHVEIPLLRSLSASNGAQIDAAINSVLRTGAKKIGILGLAFKHGTDDLRESPTVPLVKRLLGEGRTVTIYDPALCSGQLLGANQAYIQEHLPHFERLLVSDIHQAVDGQDAVVISHVDETFRSIVETSANPGLQVIDLVGISRRIKPN
jgi:GDP-mannose 6-dehydrogenase